jgi:hypothetical protein
VQVHCDEGVAIHIGPEPCVQDIHADGSTSVLHPVVDRGVTYPPPAEHMGTPIENPSAVIVGDLAIAYLQAMVAEALQLSQ